VKKIVPVNHIEMLLLIVDLYHLFTYFTSKKFKVWSTEESHGVINSIRQLFSCRWPESEVITFDQDAKINIAASSSSRKLADSTD